MSKLLRCVFSIAIVGSMLAVSSPSRADECSDALDAYQNAAEDIAPPDRLSLVSLGRDGGGLVRCPSQRGIRCRRV
jgi:hypothetical protein